MEARMCRAMFVTALLLAVALATIASRAVADPQFAAPFISFDTGVAPYSVAIGDLNGDGKRDLAVASQGTTPYFINGTVSVLLGNGARPGDSEP